MKRREFITLVGGAVATWPLSAQAQQPAIPVIGLLYAVSAEEWAARTAAMRQGLNEYRFVEGRNVAIEYRWADGHLDRLPAMAADLVGREVAVILAGGSSVATQIAFEYRFSEERFERLPVWQRSWVLKFAIESSRRHSQ